MSVKGYTVDDINAMAMARCTSYGKLYAALENGWELPPLRHSTVWPRGSSHIGEDQMPGQEPAPVTVPVGSHTPSLWSDLQRASVACSCCGSRKPRENTIRVNAKYAGCKATFGLKCARLCEDCMAQMLPGEPQPKHCIADTALRNRNGRLLTSRQIARCFQCGQVYAKEDGASIFVATYGRRVPYCHCHVCGSCFPSWRQEAAKAAAD